MPATIKVQRAGVTFGSGSDSTTATPDTVSSLTAAFARLTAVIPCSRGIALGSTADKNNDDLGMTCELTGVSTITFTREAGGENDDYRAYWELWEYIGPAGGNDEFIVRGHGSNTLSSGTAVINVAVSGISSLSDCVPFITGIRHDGTGRNWDDVNVTAKAVNIVGPGDTIEIRRGGTSGDLEVTWAMVEFTGSNWIVQNNIEHSFASAGANETESIAAVNAWDEAFIVPSFRSSGENPNLDDSAFNIWPGATTSTLRFRLNSGATTPTNSFAMAHVVENPSLNVLHEDSITGGGTDHTGGTGLQTVDQTISAPTTALAECVAFGTADSDGSGLQYPRHLWAYRLTATTNFQWQRGRGGSTSEWARQAVGWPRSPRRLVID